MTPGRRSYSMRRYARPADLEEAAERGGFPALFEHADIRHGVDSGRLVAVDIEVSWLHLPPKPRPRNFPNRG